MVIRLRVIWIYYKTLYASGQNVIVSHLNANEKHYKKYIDTLSHCHLWSTLSHLVLVLSVIISMAGVIERSKDGDKLMVDKNMILIGSWNYCQDFQGL